MGTRSLTNIVDGKKTVACIYRQFDGYPSGHGSDLAAIIAPVIMVNGLTGGNAPVANGIGCLAAQIVARLKKEPGGIYLYAPGSSDVGEEYTYTITGHLSNPLNVKVSDCDKIIFNGPPAEFAVFCAKEPT